MASRQQLADLDFGSVSRIVNLPDGTLAQHPATVAQLQAAIEGLDWKDNVRAASTASVTVSNPGTAVFDGVTLSANDRLLLKDQSTPAQNGIYIFNGSGVALTRAVDANTWLELTSAVVVVDPGGTANGGSTWRNNSAVTGTLDTTAISWTPFGTTAPAATESTAGVAEIATQTETDTGTDDQRIVTPLKLATYAGRKLKYATDVGDGSATSYTVTHNLGTRDVQVQVRRNSGNYDFVDVETRASTTNTVVVVFNAAPSAAQYRVIVLG